MAWLGGKKEAKKDVERFDVTLTDRDRLAKAFTRLSESIKELRNVPESSIETLQESVGVIAQVISSMDVKMLEEDKKQQIFDYIYYDIPTLVMEASKDFNASHVYTKLREIIKSLHAMKVDCELTEVQLILSGEYQPSSLSEADIQFSMVGPNGAYPKEIQEVLERIQSLWKFLKDEATTTEDRYFVKKAVSEYIPTTLSMFDYFQNPETTDSMYRKALNEALGHLNLLHEQLKVVNERVQKSKLSAMAAQGSFIEERFIIQEEVYKNVDAER